MVPAALCILGGPQERGDGGVHRCRQNLGFAFSQGQRVLDAACPRFSDSEVAADVGG